MPEFKLSDETRSFLTTKEFNAGARTFRGFYPSSASIAIPVDVAGDVVHGKCLREEFYLRKGFPVTNPPSAYTELIWDLGKAAEGVVLDAWKRMGVYVASNEKFGISFGELSVSGEIDAVLKEPKTGQMFGVEVKSIYGYVGEKEVFGNSSTKGYPKLSNLMQCFLYAYVFRPGNGERTELPYFKIFYISRGSAETADFTVRAVSVNGDWYPEVDGQIDKRIALSKMLERWNTLTRYLEKNELPPRDYAIKYNDYQIELYYHAGLISDSAYDKWKKGKSTTLANRPGDWNCNYCHFKSLCYSNNPPDIPGWDASKLHI